MHAIRRFVLMAALLLLAPALAPALSAQAPAGSDAAAASQAAIGAPVVLQGVTVLRVPTRQGAFTAEDRAAAIVRRMEQLARTREASLVLAPYDTSTDIMAGDMVVMTVTDADATALGRARAEVAAEFAAALTAQLNQMSRLGTLRTVAFGLLWTLLATAVLVLLLAGLARVYARLHRAIESRRARMITLRIQTLELLSADRLTDFLLAAAKFVRGGAVVVLLYFYLPLVLSFFPWTQSLSDSLLGYVITPLVGMGRAFADYLPNVFVVALTVLVTRYVLKLVHLVFGAIGRGTVRFHDFERDWAEPTYKIVRFLIIAFALVVLFPYLPGSKSEAFRGVSLFLGVLVSLGSSSAMANIVAGVVLTYTRAFNLGDRVQMGETMGDVVAKTLLVTRVRTIKNVDITIPNATVLGAHILNYTAMAKADGLILNTEVTIGYDAPWRQVHTLLIAAAEATPAILAQPKPFVLQTGLNDFYVRYQLNAYTDQPAIMAQTYSQLHANIQDKFNEGGVEIMSPHYASLRDGNPTTIPADYLPKGYTPPPFRVQRTGGGENT